MIAGFDDPELQACFKLITKATGYEMVENPAVDEPDYAQGAEIVCRTVALFTAIAKAAGKNLTVKSFRRAGEKGGFDIAGSGVVTYDAATHTYRQPVFCSATTRVPTA